MYFAIHINQKAKREKKMNLNTTNEEKNSDTPLEIFGCEFFMIRIRIDRANNVEMIIPNRKEIIATSLGSAFGLNINLLSELKLR